ncbi:hypothetical protein JQC92_21260, partial [Shewanella sp. 202IG2-18]|uniref:hypothetical protein n=1 Tax=Parashewanella hymeniacidonis TaxID=2807618 RepID=UPI001960954C
KTDSISEVMSSSFVKVVFANYIFTNSARDFELFKKLSEVLTLILTISLNLSTSAIALPS